MKIDMSNKNSTQKQSIKLANVNKLKVKLKDKEMTCGDYNL